MIKKRKMFCPYCKTWVFERLFFNNRCKKCNKKEHNKLKKAEITLTIPININDLKGGLK